MKTVSTKEQKQSIRSKTLKTRLSLAPEDVVRLSEKVCKQVISLPEFESSQVVMLYAPFRNEVDPGCILQRCRQLGKTVVLPRTIIEQSHIVPVALDPEMALTKGGYGILEPPKDAPTIDTNEVDFVCVPGVAFSTGCGRIGYGGGYYDRFMSEPGFKAFACGLAFDVQMAAQLPTEHFDLPLNVVVTESGVFRR